MIIVGDIGGDIRIPKEEELALNVLLRKHGGMHQGMQLYKIELAADTNRKLHVPVCFGDQGSYHILSWEPPSAQLAVFEHELKEDTSRGTYNCITHFVDKDGKPFKPTSFIIEHIIPILNRAKDVALAALHGEQAIVNRNRAIRKDQLIEAEKAKDRAYESYVDAVLSDSAPAFNGNPMSGSTHSANITLGDLKSEPEPQQPSDFNFTIRRPRANV